MNIELFPGLDLGYILKTGERGHHKKQCSSSVAEEDPQG